MKIPYQEVLENEGASKKLCNGCGEYKDRDLFNINKNGRYGVCFRCKECEKKARYGQRVGSFVIDKETLPYKRTPEIKRVKKDSKAVVIAKDIVRIFDGHSLSLPMNYRLAKGVRHNVYRMLTESGKRGTIGMSYKKNVLFVYSPAKKDKNKISIFKDFIKKALLFIEDEKLMGTGLKLLEEK